MNIEHLRKTKTIFPNSLIPARPNNSWSQFCGFISKNKRSIWKWSFCNL